MRTLTADGLRIVTEIADRNGVSADAAMALLGALSAGNGSQAQFNHPDLGGMGQWSAGGMIMIGDMFNQELKYRVDRLCRELTSVLGQNPFGHTQSQSQGGGEGVSLFVAGSSSRDQWWPAELADPTSTGAQNDLRYAYFEGSRRLAIQQDGRVRVYDTGEHRISGFAQAQSGAQTLTFTSQLGLLRVADLRLESPLNDNSSSASDSYDSASEIAPAASTPIAPAASPRDSQAPQLTHDAIFAAIERLADLRQKNILTEEEFLAKKRELLSRL
jgi:hypothetical protein